jgi:hypothetical protein
VRQLIHAGDASQVGKESSQRRHAVSKFLYVMSERNSEFKQIEAKTLHKNYKHISPTGSCQKQFHSLTASIQPETPWSAAYPSHTKRGAHSSRWKLTALSNQDKARHLLLGGFQERSHDAEPRSICLCHEICGSSFASAMH